MTARGFYTLLFGVIMLFTALSVGSAGAFVLGAGALLALLLALISVLFAFFSIRITQHVSADGQDLKVYRGQSCLYRLSVSMIAPLPIAPLSLRMSIPSGQSREFLLPTKMFGTTESDNRFSCPHVGMCTLGLERVIIGDCFGLFSLRHAVRDPLLLLTVLPNPRSVSPIPTSPGEGEDVSAQRAQADRTTPEDIRTWQDGDDMKRVHWKLSMRKQQLMVRTYETPQRPDALVLVDLAPPQQTGSARANVIDALTETCAGVLKSLLDSGRMTRLPLSGDRPLEMNGRQSTALYPMLTALAEESFSKPLEFERALMIASRRMRRTGSTVIITSTLTPGVAETAIALARMGPRTRVYLIAPDTLSQQQDQLLALLERCGVETEHISN